MNRLQGAPSVVDLFIFSIYALHVIDVEKVFPALWQAQRIRSKRADFSSGKGSSRWNGVPFSEARQSNSKVIRAELKWKYLDVRFQHIQNIVTFQSRIYQHILSLPFDISYVGKVLKLTFDCTWTAGLILSAPISIGDGTLTQPSHMAIHMSKKSNISPLCVSDQCTFL